MGKLKRLSQFSLKVSVESHDPTEAYTIITGESTLAKNGTVKENSIDIYQNTNSAKLPSAKTKLFKAGIFFPQSICLPEIPPFMNLCFSYYTSLCERWTHS